jgi:protease I
MNLSDKRILMFAGPMFEDLELWYPKIRMEEEGVHVVMAGLGDQQYHGKHGLQVSADCNVDDVRAADFDGVVIPGGYAPDHFRRSEHLLAVVRELYYADKMVAAICHAGWVLTSAGIARGRKLTSWHSIRDDMINAGANWEDHPAVVDHNLITARYPGDLGVFMRAVLAFLSGKVEERPAGWPQHREPHAG